MTEELYVEQLPDGRVFKCVKSQLWKTKGQSPVNKSGKVIFAEMV